MLKPSHIMGTTAIMAITVAIAAIMAVRTITAKISNKAIHIMASISIMGITVIAIIMANGNHFTQ